jgi:hypothetical protein
VLIQLLLQQQQLVQLLVVAQQPRPWQALQVRLARQGSTVLWVKLTTLHCC